MSHNILQPYVKQIGAIDNREHAWRLSRPGQDFSNLDMKQITAMDLSINSTLVYTFEVQSSILFRDMLFSLRPIHPWARSLRASPLTKNNVNLSGEFANTCVKDMRVIQSVLKDIDHGMPQDIARKRLPMTLTTNYVVSIDNRTLIGFLKSLEQDYDEIFEVYGDLFIQQLINPSEYSRSKVKPFTDAYLISENELDQKGIQKVGDMVFACYDMNLVLGAQLLRMHNAKVKTWLWSEFKEFGYLTCDLQQNSMVPMVMYAEKSAYDRLMKQRCHWLADWQTDMWGGIVGDYIKDMSTLDFWNFIPGGAVPDPYIGDMEARITREDPNLPSAIALEMPQLIIERIEQFGSNAIIDKYRDLVMAGYIKDNPNNKLRIRYEQRQIRIV